MNTIAKNTGVPRANLKLTIPNQKAPLQALGFDVDGRLWVERSTVDGQPGEADVYDRSGKWMAIMQWPAGVSTRFWTVHARTSYAARDIEWGVRFADMYDRSRNDELAIDVRKLSHLEGWRTTSA